MVVCCVIGCQHRSSRGTCKCSFFRIPKVLTHRGQAHFQLSKERRRKFISAINRKTWEPSFHARICSCHFVDGRPADLIDKSNPNWIPSQNMGYKMKKVSQNGIDEHESPEVPSFNELCPNDVVIKEERETEDGTDAIDAIQTEIIKQEIHDLETRLHHLRSLIGQQQEGTSLQTGHNDCNHECNNTVQLPDSNDESKINISEIVLQLMNVTRQLQEEDERRSKRRNSLDVRAEWQESILFSADSLRNDSKMLHFYTGIREWAAFESLFELVRPRLLDGEKLSKFQKFVMFFVKLHLNLFDQDLGYRFNVNRAVCGQTCDEMVAVLRANPSIQEQFLAVTPITEHLF